MKLRLLLLLALGSLSVLSAEARPYHLTTVRWIVATRNKITYDDRYVTIVGHVTRRMGSEEYWFTDGTGSVRLDSENFDLPVGPRLIIGGRIDQAYLGFGHIEVDVRKWSYAPVHRVPPSIAVAHRAPVSAATPAPSPAPVPAAPEPVSSAPPVTPIMTAPEAPATNTPPSLAPPTEASFSTPSGPIPATPSPDSATAPAPANTPPATPASTVPASTNAAP